MQNMSFLWGIVLGLLGVLLISFKLFFKFFLKKRGGIIFILLAALITGGAMIYKGGDKKKVIILGIDAMDPQITEQLMQEGKMPNLSYLKRTGTYSRLKTTMPPESVVAWTSFITGLNPGSHGIFDFVMRQPQNYLLYLSLNEISNTQGKVRIKTHRKGEAFWRILSKNKIPASIYFCPNTFPAERVSGKMLSGMGTPDITGITGRFSFYTTGPFSPEDKNSRGKIIHVGLKGKMIETSIYGPKIISAGLVKEAAIPLKIILASDTNKVILRFQGKELTLDKDSWSSWQEVSFDIGRIRKLRGIVRFYLTSTGREFGLYASPVNLDPRQSTFPVSYPKGYAGALVKRTGLYYTQGMPHDSWALTEGRLTEDAFLSHADIILGEKRLILEEELSKFKKGVFFFYIDTLDVIQHMFWRYLDTRHFLYEENSRHKDVISKYYEKIDQLLGLVLKRMDQDTTLIILSDHGFNYFRKAVNLNRFLADNGLLFLKEGKKEGRDFFEDVDWSKTKAYALGFGGIYLNRIGREYYGIVDASEAQGLKQEIINKLRQLKDPQSKEAVVNNVYTKEEIFQGRYSKDAPDIFVGFNAGYRASWQTALGGTPGGLFEDNKKKWSGDHLIDSGLVPGVIFINKKLGLKEPAIIDIAPTVLNLFGIAKSDEMQGKVLFRDENR